MVEPVAYSRYWLQYLSFSLESMIFTELSCVKQLYAAYFNTALVNHEFESCYTLYLLLRMIPHLLPTWDSKYLSQYSDQPTQPTADESVT